ncbi:conjugal transfer protein [Legionella sp. 16cNR16C]|uniref:conjugal transfer protein n=1 Tax=Legionella sp. 16cNR16C TaxID=2905656 RepID=UPI001E4E2B9D|nr:conjugal transfer protein [Legionella sp. 16cNR16C]MCE3045414.1 conjugal transfer protein [Legionella sp. 16cNR16C]
MKLSMVVFMSILSVLLTGCGTMNSNFSCNVTAGDSCLTIEQVDAMTRFADDVKTDPPKRGMMKAGNEIKAIEGTIIQQHKGQSVWVATHSGGQSWA